MSYLNISSREKLDMDVNETVANHRNVFKSNDTQMQTKNTGFLSKNWMALLVVIVAIALVVGLSIFIAFHHFDCACDNSTNIVPNCISDANQSTNQFISTLESSNRSYVRLPVNLKPNHYDVYLQTYIGPQQFYFDGNVTIHLNCTGNTFNITLHSNDLIINNDSVSLLDESETPLPYISNVTYDNKLQFFIVNLNTELKSGKNYMLRLKFRGNLNDDLVGFYRSSYKDVNGNKRWLAVTQFQPTDARRAFPCFDEPAMKATFSITLIHYKNMTAVSNMPLVKKDVREDWVSDTFEQTVKMSTYLLAFLVSDFEYLTDKSANFSVWSRPGTIHTANYSLNVGPKILRFYEDYFNVSYPLPKTDMVAVPDFNAGAMENWGLIVYRETAMLFDPTVSSDSNMQRVATVVAHELAHQWFGNLVTPKWWDDLWLNEGFASYMEYEGVHAVHPTWQMFQQFVVDEIHNVFELDCLTTSHPISVEVRNPEEINEIFDRISYGKGASIIRMMTFFLGRDTFRRGVSNYLNAFRYDNAVQNDLWNYLTLAANSSVNVKAVMDSWTLQDGYPVVTLIRHYSDRKASLTQKRFLLSTANESTEIDTTKYSWEIPITYTDSRNAIWEPITKLWMHRSDPVIALPSEHVPDRNHWIIVNLQEVGYYRVNYDTDNWKLIIRQLVDDHTLIHTINRAQIIDDALDLAQAHLLDYRIALNTTEYLINENQFVPWEAALNAFSFLDRMLRRHSAYGMWKDYVLELISKLYLKVGWDVSEGTEDILDKYSQLNIIGWACKYAHQHCIQQSLIRFKQWQHSNQTNTIHPNLRNVVYCIGIEYGVEKDWDFVWNKYVTEQLASEKDKLLRALSCSREPWLLSRYITRAFNGSSGIRKQDGSYVFKSVAANNFGRNIAFDFLREKWDLILKYYGKSFFSFGTLIKAVTSSLNTEFELKQLHEFYNQVKDNVGTAQRTFKQALEQTTANVEWMQNNYQEIELWLQQRQLKKDR